MKGKLIRPALVALVVVAALLVVGGIAYATIPDSSGVIHGCYKNNQGTLRIVDSGQGQTCSSSETALDWSQTGPQGQPGQPGATGPRGPSDVYSVDGYDAGQKTLGLTTWVNLATTPTLPAGSYVVQGETTMDNFFTVTTDYSCDLVDSESNEYQVQRVTGPSTLQNWVTVPLQTVVTLESPDTISLRCFASQTGAEAFNWKLTALAVGTVHS